MTSDVERAAEHIVAAYDVARARRQATFPRTSVFPATGEVQSALWLRWSLVLTPGEVQRLCRGAGLGLRDLPS